MNPVGEKRSREWDALPNRLERHLQGLTEKLRSGVNGKVREVIERAVSRIVVGVDGGLTIEVKPGGLLDWVEQSHGG